jgi:hypothetical protein
MLNIRVFFIKELNTVPELGVENSCYITKYMWDLAELCVEVSVLITW